MKYIIALLILFMSVTSYADEVTPNYNLVIPGVGGRNWQSTMSDDLISIDAVLAIISSDPVAWVDDGTNVRLTTATDGVTIGYSGIESGVKLGVEGKLTCDVITTDAGIIIGDNFLYVGEDNGIARVGIGTNEPDVLLQLGVNGYAGFNLDSYHNGISRSLLALRKSKSNTVDTKVQTSDGNTLGELQFHGVDAASNFDLGASITAIQDGTAGAKVPADLILETFTDTAKNTNQLVLDTNGGIALGYSEAEVGVRLGVAGKITADVLTLDTGMVIDTNHLYVGEIGGEPVVGIGTNTPKTTFEIKSAAAHLTLNHTSDALNTQIGFEQNGANHAAIFAYGPSFGVASLRNDIEIDSAGDIFLDSFVGIKTDTPTVTLDVVGTISADTYRFDMQAGSPDTATLTGPALYVDSADNTLRIWTGADWLKVTLE